MRGDGRLRWLNVLTERAGNPEKRADRARRKEWAGLTTGGGPCGKSVAQSSAAFSDRSRKHMTSSASELHDST